MALITRLEANSDEPYATLFSRCDLTLNGGGHPERDQRSYRHAVCSKDDLSRCIVERTTSPQWKMVCAGATA